MNLPLDKALSFQEFKLLSFEVVGELECWAQWEQKFELFGFCSLHYG